MFDTAGISRTGTRAINMDAWKSAVEGGAGCWALADGLGGHAHSEVAAKMAVDAVIDGFRQRPIVSTAAVEDLIERANAAVLAAKGGHPEYRQMATTLVVLVSDGRQAVWGHVGDSRLYLLRNGAVFSQTLDHSIAQARVNAGDIAQEQLRKDRSGGGLLKAVGNSSRLVPTIAAPQSLFQGDSFLLCVDGFWEHVHEVEMEIDFSKSLNAEDWLRYLERRIAKRNSADGDNYTALAVRIDNAALPSFHPRVLAPSVPASPLSKPGNRDSISTAALKGKVSNKKVWLALGALTLAVIGMTFLSAHNWEFLKTPQSVAPVTQEVSAQDCAEEWRKAREQKSEQSFNTFISRFPKCPQENDALLAIGDLKMWKGTNTADRESVRAYLREYEHGIMADVANDLLSKNKFDSSPTPTPMPTPKVRELQAAAVSVTPKDCKKVTLEWKKLGDNNFESVNEFWLKWKNACPKEVDSVHKSLKDITWRQHRAIKNQIEGASGKLPRPLLIQVQTEFDKASKLRTEFEFEQAMRAYSRTEELLKSVRPKETGENTSNSITPEETSKKAASPEKLPASEKGGAQEKGAASEKGSATEKGGASEKGSATEKGGASEKAPASE